MRGTCFRELRYGKEITVLDKNEKNLDYVRRYGVKALHTDLAEKQGWYDEFNGKEVVINLAAQISSPNPELFYRNNEPTDDKNTEFLIDFAKKIPFFPDTGSWEMPGQPIYACREIERSCFRGC